MVDPTTIKILPHKYYAGVFNRKVGEGFKR